LLKSGINIVKLFSPEHGLDARGADGVYQHHMKDPLTGLPVISLYGDYLLPSEEDMSSIDAVLFDIPDAGCRFYTYLWTLTYVMEACAKYKKPLIILDRPNPINGIIALAEGPMLDEKNCSSFIGRWNIPIRHSCTLGELAAYFAASRLPTLELEIIRAKNWNRNLTAAETNQPFVPPSPAILDPVIALLYPGMGLMEGININEGRGTANPFRVLGAPWIDAPLMQQSFASLELPGIRSNTIEYKPVSGLYADQHCKGLFFEITELSSFRPVHTGICLLELIISLYPEECRERLYPSRASPSGTEHLDKLTGVYRSFELARTGSLTTFHSQKTGWKETIQPFLLY
jgi:uncharacterized protein YbbC (DUF1343 family)